MPASQPINATCESTSATRPSVHDLAKWLSLSPSTVSRALNGRPGVRPKTLKRVTRAAERYGYVPNLQAQALRTGSNRQVGVLIPSLAGPPFPELIHSMHRHARAAGYDISLNVSEWDVDNERDICRHLLSRRVAGLVSLSIADPAQTEHLRQLRDAGVPVLVINSAPLDIEGAAQLQVDAPAAMGGLARHLLELGHQHIVVIGIGPDWRDNPVHRSRLAAIREAVRTCRPDVDPDAVIELIPSPEDQPMDTAESGHAAVTQRLAAGGPLPTAIQAVNDYVAMCAVWALQHHSYRVPEDVSVTGYGDVGMAGLMHPSLTTASKTRHDLGKLAFERMLTMIDGEDDPSPRSLLPEVVVRGSTAATSRTAVRCGSSFH